MANGANSYHHAESFNQTLGAVLGGDTSEAVGEFCAGFISTFNNDSYAAKLITTNKLEMASNAREDTAQLGATGVLDVAGAFGLPTGVLGSLAQRAISALFKGARSKRYKKVAKMTRHMTQVEIMTQALALGLVVHYKDELLDEDTLPKPGFYGERAAKKLLDTLKSKSKKSLMLASDDNLLQHLKAMLEWCVKKEYIREEFEGGQPMPSFDTDDYATLLLFASAELLGLPRKHFVEAQQQKESLATLEKQLLSIEEDLDKIETKVQTMIAEAIARNSRPEDVYVAMEKGAILEGEFSMDIDCVIDTVNSNMTAEDAKHKNFMALLSQRHQENLELMDKTHKFLENRDRKVTGLQAGAKVNKGGKLELTVGGSKRGLNYKDPSTLPPKTEPGVDSQPHATSSSGEDATPKP